MAFISATKEFKKHALDDKEFLGVVEFNNDPQKLGRIKIRVKEVFGTQIPTDDLPWSMPLRALMFGAGSNLSWFSVPEVGTRVIVRFHRGSVYTPMYVAEPLSLTELIPDMSTNYPNRYGFVDPNGSMFIVDTVDQTVKYSHVSGTVMNIFTDGAMDVDHFSGTRFQILDDGNVLATVVKSVTWDVTDDITFNATNINFNASDLIAMTGDGLTGNFTGAGVDWTV